MRAVLLPCIDSYPEVGMWMKMYERWQSEVDELRICFGKPHGEALTKMVTETKAEYLLFCEMDGIIFTRDIVDRLFKMLEHDEVDVIGSPRMSCSPQIAEIAQKRFGLDYTGLGDKGPNFWPNFFFVKKSILLQTDLNFMNKEWKKGETLFGETLTDDVAGDTMVWMSLQLRDLVPKERIIELPQYHTHPDDLEDLKNHTGIFDHHAQWIHLGSVSGSFFLPSNTMERKELTKRLVWQELCGKNVKLEKTCVEKSDFDQWKAAYKDLLDL